MANDSLVDRECPACGKTYSADLARLKHGRQTTCSRECSYRLRHEKKRIATTLDCCVCGKEVSRPPSHIKNKQGRVFCSRDCHYAARSLGISRRPSGLKYVISEAGRANWKTGAAKTREKRIANGSHRHTDESRAKLSEATARALAEGKCGRVSKIEDEVASELDRLGVQHARQFPFRDNLGRFAAVADFFIPDMNAVIEVNGTYWHVDPRVYPAPINSMQARCLAKYNRKLDLFARLNIRVAEVWEMDIKQDVAKAVLEAHARLSVA